MRLLTPLVVLALAASVASVAACASSSSTADAGCSSNPFACAAGQTCTVKDTSGAFACLPSGAGKKGDSCVNTPGATTCGDTLTCLQLTQSGGACTSYCEPGNAAHACPADEKCSAAGLQGTSTIFYVCAGGTPTPTTDAGASDAGASDAAHD